jgi:hypothetical protein
MMETVSSCEKSVNVYQMTMFLCVMTQCRLVGRGIEEQQHHLYCRKNLGCMAWCSVKDRGQPLPFHLSMKIFSGTRTDNREKCA